MEKKFISVKDGEQEAWYQKAREQTLETLPSFLNSMLDGYSHDQYTIVDAMVAGAMATLAAMNAHPEGELSSSQTQALLGIFIRRWARIEGPAKIMSWAGLLNPSNEQQVMTVPKDVVKWLADLAARALKEGKFKDEAHRVHLEKLTAGEMPWGLK